MNRIMYVEGNPIAYLDPDGNSTCAPKGGSVWAGNYVGPGAGGYAGSYLYSDYTDWSRALKFSSPLVGYVIHIINPELVSLETASIYYGLHYLKNPLKKCSI